MSHRSMIGILVVGLLALGGWALAQQKQPDVKARPPEGGPFVVSPAGDTAVLLETKSGKTWTLHRSVEGESVWLPAMHITSQEEVLRWRKREEAIKRVRAEEAADEADRKRRK